MSSAPSKPTFLQEIANSPTTTVFDLESNGYLEETTEIHCVAWDNPHHPEPLVTRDTEAAMGSLRCFDVLVGHNIIGFDVPVLHKLGFEPCKKGVLLIDTLVLSQLAYPNLYLLDAIQKKIPEEFYGKHKLKAWGFRLDALKDDYEGGFETWNQEMQDYNKQDVVVTRKVLEHLAGKILPERAIRTEMDIAFLMRSMERKGVKFDERGAMNLFAKLETIRSTRLDELQVTFPPVPSKVTGIYGGQIKRAHKLLLSWGYNPETFQPEADTVIRGRLEAEKIKFKRTKEIPFNPSSGQQIADRMKDLGWIPTKFTETGLPKVDEPVIVMLANNFEEARPLADYLLSSKRMGQISNPKTQNGWLNHLTDDGRIHGRANPMGCISYRFSHSRPNLGQVPANGSPYGPECRALFGVGPGMDLMGVDAAGLELRFLGHYMAPWDGGAFAKAAAFGKKDDGTDIHTVNQRKAGLPTRDQAKTFIYALIYGAGDAKLGQIMLPKCNDKMRLIKTGKGIRARFLKNTPALRLLTKAVKAKASKHKKLIGLDGRILHVRSAHSALNLLLQSAGAIAIKEATVLFHVLMTEHGFTFEEAWWFVLHVHDEWQVECLKEISHEAAIIACKSIELAGTNLGLVVPLAGEAAVGATWRETH